MGCKRIALKIAYLGTNFDGFQIQPEKRTVEGEIFRALKDHKLIQNPRNARYQAAGRTDKGVHAIGQVIAFNTSKPALALPRVINSKLPDSIWAWAHAAVADDFDPRRHAVKREYRYVLPDDHLDIKRIKSAARFFKGKQDFANFTTREEGKSAVRTLIEVKVRKLGDFLIFDISGESFAWNMVRKIVTALKMIGRQERDEDWIELMLTPSNHREGLQNAPAHGLILKNVSYRGISFEEEIYAKKKACRKLEEWFERYSVMGKILGEMKSAME